MIPLRICCFSVTPASAKLFCPTASQKSCWIRSLRNLFFRSPPVWTAGPENLYQRTAGSRKLPQYLRLWSAHHRWSGYRADQHLHDITIFCMPEWADPQAEIHADFHESGALRYCIYLFGTYLFPDFEQLYHPASVWQWYPTLQKTNRKIRFFP